MTRMLMVTDVQDIIKRHQAQIITSLKDPDIRLNFSFFYPFENYKILGTFYLTIPFRGILQGGHFSRTKKWVHSVT